ncbi:cytochrome P450 [Paenarthrobacter sp. NPDC058040]|uniref:cytochrome P450 n=1 Tax=unclassified Paenarthrobacter TaxID=2634190 RepID=UPI0036DE2882
MTVNAIQTRRVNPYSPPAEHLELQGEEAVAFLDWRDGRKAWAITKHADVRTMLSDVRFSSDRSLPDHPAHGGYVPGAHKGAIIAIDPPEHSTIRARVMNEFTVKKISLMRPRIEEIVTQAIDAMLDGKSEAELVEELSLPVPAMAIAELLGVPYEDHDFFQRNTALFSDSHVDPDRRGKAIAELRDYISNLVDLRVENRGNDIISRQLDAGADAEEAVGLGFLLLIAGHETTANMISLSIMTLLDRPELLQQLRDDPALIPGAVEEMLRYFTIAEVGGLRLATADIEIGGKQIHAGDAVYGLTNTANRDPEVFPDPHTINFSRGARNHMAFGFGPHQCLGQNLARLELVVVLEHVIKRIPTLRLVDPLSAIAFKEWGPNYGINELKVAW